MGKKDHNFSRQVKSNSHQCNYRDRQPIVGAQFAQTQRHCIFLSSIFCSLAGLSSSTRECRRLSVHDEAAVSCCFFLSFVLHFVYARFLADTRPKFECCSLVTVVSNTIYSSNKISSNRRAFSVTTSFRYKRHFQNRRWHCEFSFSGKEKNRFAIPSVFTVCHIQFHFEL